MSRASSTSAATARAWSTWGLGLALPVALIVLILGADALESPKTA